MAAAISKIVITNLDGSTKVCSVAEYKLLSSSERVKLILQQKVKFFDLAGGVIPGVDAIKILG